MKLKRYCQGFIKVLGSRNFFYGIVGLFLLHALWLALTSRYPMAFDENYHYGIIQQYARQFSPFFASPPPGTESLGDITRYPSYLFHYLMSFPYRLIAEVTSSEAVRIISLRIINIGLLASSLIIFRKLFQTAKLSPAIANLSLLLFVLIPVTPFLAGQISYDNLSIPLTGLTLLFGLRFLQKLQHGEFSLSNFYLLVVVGMFTSLVKYTYLPIIVTVMAYVLVATWWYRRQQKIELSPQITKQVRNIAPLKKWLLLGVVLIGGLLSIERYGLNIVRYHHPAPDCAKILSADSCRQYGPWGRDERLKARRETAEPTWRVIDYHKVWASTMRYEFFFTINDRYESREPLPLLYTFSKVMLWTGGLLTIAFSWRWLKNSNLRFFALVSVVYLVLLWADNYLKFRGVHWPVAIHGRYLLPLLPVIFVIMGYGIKSALDLLPRYAQLAKVLIALSCCAIFTLSGGAVTYIVRSDSSWYWSNSLVTTANHAAQRITRPFLK